MKDNSNNGQWQETLLILILSCCHLKVLFSIYFTLSHFVSLLFCVLNQNNEIKKENITNLES